MNNTENSINESESCILVEGPGWADAEFYGKWLLAAAKAEALWTEALEDPIFQKQVELLTIMYLPDFSIAATVMISQLEKNLVSFAIQLNGKEVELVDEFVIMADMGFFVLTGQRYKMTIPTKLNVESVKMAAHTYAKTAEDPEEDWLHPECLITTMPYAEAKVWQERLRNVAIARGGDDWALLSTHTGSASRH
jgi:hypothetical protein